MSAVFVDASHLDWFIEWTLMDKAERPHSRRGGVPMFGMWCSRQGLTRMRGSDARERRYVCILVLRRWGGLSEDDAVSTVAQRLLGRGVSVKKMNSFRTDFYGYDHPLKEHALEEYWYSFLRWKMWLIHQDALDRTDPLKDGRSRVRFVADQIRKETGEKAALEFEELALRVLAGSPPLYARDALSVSDPALARPGVG